MNLFKTACKGAVLWVEQMVNASTKVENMDSLHRTSLIEAACGGHLEVVRLFVEHGAPVDDSNNDGETPLSQAAAGGHLEVIRFLVEHGAAVDGSSSDGSQTPLMQAVVGGHLDVVRFLLKCGAAVDAIVVDGNKSLMWAARSGNLRMVHCIVECGVSVDGNDTVADSDDETPSMWSYLTNRLNMPGNASDSKMPIIWARRGGHLEVVRSFLKRGAAVDGSYSDAQTPLKQAVVGGHLDVVRFLLKCGADVDAIVVDGNKSLMRAVRNGDLRMVHCIVECGVSVDGSESDGVTPLIEAVRSGHLDVVRFLIGRGAAVIGIDINNLTPLMHAAAGGHLDVVRFLVEHGTAVDGSKSDYHHRLLYFSTSRWGYHAYHTHPPLVRAARSGHLDVVRFLVECGAVVDGSNSDGETPLSQAAAGGHLEVVRFLVEHGAPVDVINNDGETSLSQAAAGGHLEMVRFLVEHGAAVDGSSSGSRTPLMQAVNGGHLDVVRFLVRCGAAVDAIVVDGNKSLMRAVRNGDLRMVRCIVECGVSVDGNDTVADNDGESHRETPIMCAARGGHLEVTSFLVKHGANVDLVSGDGDTALRIATKFGHQNIVQLLFPHIRYQDQRGSTAQHSSIPSNWLINPFEIEVEPFVDAGNIGVEYRGKWLDANVVVMLFIEDAASATFIDEVRLWHQLRHPNVLKLYGVCNSHHLFFVCEYASKGSLTEYLKSCTTVNQTPWKFILETALGLQYLHERKIVHGNLRGSNILIGSDGLVKLSGFGLSASSPNGPNGSSYISSALVRWASPEILKGDKISLASDVYSLGMCIIEVVSGAIPYNGQRNSTVEFAKTHYGNGMINLTNQFTRITVEQLKLVFAMCYKDPAKRLQISAVVNKLERFAEKEAANLNRHKAQFDPEEIFAFDEFDHGRYIHEPVKILWIAVEELVAQSENPLYRQVWHELELIYNILEVKKHSYSILKRFHDLLNEYRFALDAMSKQTQICRLSATRARAHSVQGLHRRITLLLQLIHPQDHDGETRETEWKRLCRELVEVFVSETSEACVLLNSVDSEEDRLALVAVLRAEVRNSDGRYTEEQLTKLQKAYERIQSKSLEDTQRATTPEWFIPWFELEMNEMERLGQGGFGSVIKAKWLDSEVVVKKLEFSDKEEASTSIFAGSLSAFTSEISLQAEDKKREMRKMFKREVDIWFGLSHPHVVQLFGACHVGRPFFVCELAPNGTLVKYLRDHPDELWVKLHEAALGIQYLHARGIVHGDLKGNNILIGSDGKSKVTDFGLSGMLDDDSPEVLVSAALHWVAPECILGQKPTFASDIYSLGMCIIEALRATNGDENDLPWGNLLNAAVKYNVTKNHLLPQPPKSCSNEAWTLIERMCTKAPADRILIITVVDELEKLACQRKDLNGEVDYGSVSVADTLAEMKTSLVKCDAKSDYERGVLKKIYQLLFDRLEHVTTQLGEITRHSDFTTVVEHSTQRTRAVFGVTDSIPLIKFTELVLGGYALHRRLDKFIAAHAVARGSSLIHDWTSACSTFMEASTSLPQHKAHRNT